MGPAELPSSTYRTIVETAISPFLIIDGEGTVQWVGESIRELLGHEPAELMGRSGLRLIHPDSRSDALDAMSQVAELAPGREAGWTSSGLVVDFLSVDGRRVSCDVSVATAVRTGLDGQYVFQLRRAVGASALQRTVAAMAAGESCDTVFTVVAEMFAEGLAHASFEILYDWTGNRFTSQVGAPSAVVDLGDTDATSPWLTAARSGQPGRIDSVANLGPSTRVAAQASGVVGGLVRPVAIDLMEHPAAVVVAWWHSLARSPIFEYRLDQAADLVGLVLQWYEGRRALEWEANHDALTALNNRRAFIERVGASIESGESGAVFYLDLDDFKAVNDQHGHLLGDRMLASVAERLRASTRPGDLVARLGGDEFAVYCPRLDDPEAADERATRFVDALRDPISVEGVTATIGTSVGLAMVEPGATLDDVLAAADARLLQAKAAGKSQIVGPGQDSIEPTHRQSSRE